jgi:hypothetical protein
MNWRKRFSGKAVKGWCLLLSLALAGSTRLFAGSSASLDQAANGSFSSPASPVNWQNGNANQNNSHYAEGQSIPYRLIMTGLSKGSHTVVIEWDIRNSSENAIDYITSFGRIAESVNPLSGVSGTFGPPVSVPIPLPVPSTNVNGFPQPQTSFNSLSSSEQQFTIYNGTITNLAYSTNSQGNLGDLTASQSASDLRIVFTTTNSTVVLAWGGHIASRLDWGVSNSAGGISGSPYHTRLISFDGSGGNQDRSLKAVAVCVSPTNLLVGPDSVCPSSTRLFTDQSDAQIFNWSLTGNASFVGPVTNSYVSVLAASSGSFTVTVTAAANAGSLACATSVSKTVIINPPPACSISGNLVVCPSSQTNTYVGPGGMSIYAWSIAGNGSLIGPANQSTVSVTAGPACGTPFTLSLAVTNSSGCGTVCTQSVQVIDTTPPQITCPANIIAPESPRDSGGAVVFYPAPTATDDCDPAPVVSSLPAAGSVFPVGSNTVTCLATDHCGNTNGCTFAIRVIPYRLWVTNINDSGPGSLRQALLDANDSSDANLVLFNLGTGGPFTIHLLSALPEITSPVVIDGWSQSGSNAPPVVVLDGSQAGTLSDGLVLTAPSNTVRGLVLTGFINALRLQSNGFNVVQGNFIGTDSTGTNAAPNTGDGLYVTSRGNVLGGTLPGQGNVIAGNLGNGLEFVSPNAVSNLVQGNLIGVGADAATALGNQQNGIRFAGQASFNAAGGAATGASNVITFNGRNGITLAADAGFNNKFSQNSIYQNGALGIDLGDDGVTLNGSGSPNGPNHSQPFPVLTDAQSQNGTTTIFGQFAGSPFTTYQLEFFLNDVADPSGYGEGQALIGTLTLLLDGTGTAKFTVSFPVSAVYTQFITATATSPGGDTSEFSGAVQVRTPPVIKSQPLSTNDTVGGGATFCATVSGTPPIFYQWRLNGWNIAGATNPCYTIPAAQLGQGGTYSVVVGNVLGAIATIPITLTFNLPQLPAGDMFSNRVALVGESGIVAGNNINATSEPGEPLHAGKPGGSSVWYTWTAPNTGVVSLQTIGSTFDTLLAVYSGMSVTSLVSLASDEDHGGFYTSALKFDAFNGQQYQFAIDGFGGAQGDFVFSWQEQDTSHMLPVFLVQPVDQTVIPGGTATFTGVGARVCGNGQINCNNPSPEQLLYQWLYYGSPIPGATASTLTISNVQPSMLGNYALQISTPWQTNVSQTAVLQLNTTAGSAENVQAMNKFLDSADSNPLLIGAISGASTGSTASTTLIAAGAVVSGYTGTQTFNTGGSGSTPTETICGVIGGSSEWLTFVPQASGILNLNTDGSSYDTVMAVFRRNPTNSSLLQLINCDNNSGANGKTSALGYSAIAGQTNYVEVDGLNGATGTLVLNYSLMNPAVLKSLGVTTQRAVHLQVNGLPSMHFTIQTSTNLLNWSALLTTNSASGTFDYIDNASPGIPRRFYRALMLP